MTDLPPEWITLVKSAEAWRAEPYLDPVGIPTIGYGHRIPSLDHPAITEAEGEAMLRDDMALALSAAIGASPVLAKSGARRAAAIGDFCFNVGPAKYVTSTLKHYVDLERWTEAAKQNRRWVHGSVNGRDEILPGLVKRRAVTSTWLEEG